MCVCIFFLSVCVCAMTGSEAGPRKAGRSRCQPTGEKWTNCFLLRRLSPPFFFLPSAYLPPLNASKTIAHTPSSPSLRSTLFSLTAPPPFLERLSFSLCVDHSVSCRAVNSTGRHQLWLYLRITRHRNESLPLFLAQASSGTPPPPLRLQGDCQFNFNEVSH